MLRVVTQAAADPVTLDEAKAHLRVDDSDQDGRIGSLIKAATLFCESLTQRAFVTRTMEWVLPNFCSALDVPLAPITVDGIGSIKYVDLQNVQRTLDPSFYVVRSRIGPSVSIVPVFGNVWPFVSLAPAPEPVVVRFTVGDDDVAENIKQAILLTVGHLYENREAVVVSNREQAIELPRGADALLMSEIWS